MISHVPVVYFLIDSTIEDNVIFMKELKDQEKLEETLARAQAKDFVESLPNKIHTLIGESGSRL